MSKKILSILLSLVLAVTSLSVAFVSYADDLSGKTVIICTSNLRGDIDKLPKISALKKDYQKKGANVVLADTGNFLQGSLYASADRGYTVFTLMEKAGYDVVALGKYDFAFGSAQTGAKPHGTLKQYLTLSQLLNGGENDLLTKEKSNIIAVSSNAEGSNEYFTFSENMKADTVISGVKFFGYTSPDVSKTVLEDSIKGISFSKLDSVKEDGEYTVCLSNAGNVDADLTISPKSSDFEISGVILNESKEASPLSIDLDSVEADTETATAVTAERGKIDGEYPENALAKSEVILNGLQSEVRSKETNLGDLWCDALLNYASKQELEVESDKVVALWNGGNLRDFLYDGNINIQDIHKVLPYPNTTAILYVKGSALLEALEAAGQYDAAFTSVAGMKYTINEYYEFEGGEEYEGSTWKQPLSNRVTINEVGGKAFDRDAVYAVVTSNMIFNGGDTFLAFKNKAEGYNSFNSSEKVVNVVWNYIKDNLGGTIPEKYAEPQGRISIINEAPVEPEPEKISIAKASVSGIKTKTYTGKKLTQSVKVKLGKKTLSASDYTVSYKNNKNVGKATLTVTGKGIYTGKITKTFNIIPKATSITKITNTKKKFTVKWKKQKAQTTGYQLQYGTDKSFKKNTKTVKIKNVKTLKKAIKKAKAKKKYYVRIRTYKTVSKKNYYSNWSKTKTIKAK